MPSRSSTGGVVSLKRRVVRDFVLVGAVLVVLMAGLTFLFTGQMVDAVAEKEAKRAWDRIAAVEKAKADLLRAFADDYAYWNEMAEFAAAGTDGFPQAHFDTWFFDNADADGLLVLSPEDEVRVAIAATRAAAALGVGASVPDAFDAGSGLKPLPDGLVARLRALPGAAVVRNGGATGVTWIPWNGGWVQVAIAAIGRRGEAPNGGLLFLLRAADANRLASRAVEAQVDYRIAAIDPARAPMVATAGASLLAVPLEDPILGVSAMAVARAVDGTAAILGRVQVATVIQQTVLLGALIFVLIRLLSRQVLDRVRLLRRDVEALRHGDSRRPDLPGPRDELALLGEEFSAVFRALDKARTEWRKAALRDPLTGLGNRAALQARLEVLFSAGRRWPSSLYLVDLDGFKAINDVHGHAKGDELLMAVSRDLDARLAERAEVFRLGGDEYAIVLHDGGDLGDEVLGIVAEVVAFDAAGQPLRIRASVGRAALEEGVESPGDWLRRADIAMYEAKRAGGGRVVGYVPSMHESLLERESIERRLRRALDERRIDVAFQPIVAAADGRLAAVEALARWHDAERGRVPPARFIPIAEEAGFSAELDLMVLEKALGVFVGLRQRQPEVVLQVNLAPPSLLTPGLVDRIATLVDAAGVPPEALLFEVTESALAADPAAVSAVVASLRDRRLRIALDDFGTGYSSMARLAELKPSALKIDGQFVRDHEGDGDRIIRSILGLARAFGLHATAEFVETEAQCRYLRELGCDALQGYGIAQPMPGEALLAWVDARASDATR